MAISSTFKLLEKVTLASPQSSVTFMNAGNIPSGYTDLLVRASVRSSTTSGNSNLIVYFNGTNGTAYNMMQGLGDGNGNQTRVAQTSYPWIEASPSITNANGNYTANTFTNLEVWIQNYRQTILAQSASNTLVASESNTATCITGITNNSFVNSGNPINTITIDGTDNFIAGSTFYLYGIANVPTSGSPYATGGNIISTDGTYWYHAFTTSGTFIPNKAISTDILTVGGGGNGGGATSGQQYGSPGGGGAGGIFYATSQSLTKDSSYTVTIGAGGAASINTMTNGNNSQFASLTVGLGGGAGAVSYGTGASGGCGGGGAGGGSGGATNQSSIGGTGYGFAGNVSGGGYAGGGGGGAGAIGGSQPGNNYQAGNGGNGTSAFSSLLAATSLGQNISGTYYIAGGGGGGASPYYGTPTAATGGYGGGGTGGLGAAGPYGTAGAVNTGGGGGGVGGRASSSGDVIGNSGGSGVVIIRYAV